MMHSVEAPSLHMICCGSGDPILFLHGMPTSGRLWNGIIRRLCGRYRCFAVDLPGLGRSPSLPYDVGYMKRVAEQIDQIRIANKIEKWHVVGHDAGSVVAVHYAHYFPEHVACMALLSPALFPDLKPFYLLEVLRKPIVGEMLAPLILAVFWKIAMRRALHDSEDRELAIKDFYRPFSTIRGPWRFMRVLRWGKPALVLADVPGFLPTLKMPTLIFYGSHDVAIPAAFAQRAFELMPNASLVALESGHFIPLNQPEPVASRLSDFFDHHPRLCEIEGHV